MHAPYIRRLREAAIGAANDVFTPDQFGETGEAIGDQLRVFHDIGHVADNTGNELAAGGQFYAFPHAPLMFVPRVCHFNAVAAGLHLKDQIDDIL